MDEKKLLKITKGGCPDCGSIFNLYVTGLESFKQSVGYNAIDDEVVWGEPDCLGVTEAAVCCIMCGWEEALSPETLTFERRYKDSELWEGVCKELVQRVLSNYYSSSDILIKELEKAALVNVPEPSHTVYTPFALYRARKP